MRSFTKEVVSKIYSLISDVDVFTPPFFTKGNDSYHKNLESRYKLFEIKAKGFLYDSKVSQDDIDEYLLSYEKITNGIILSIGEYLKGNPKRSYEIFNDTLEKDELLGRYFSSFYTKLEDKNISIKNDCLYRVRVSESYLSKADEMFHVPFDKRHLVSNQRYSIAGLPSLYLGSSILCCWEEMDKPDLNKIYVSKFKALDKVDIRIFDFAYKISNEKGVLPLGQDWGDDLNRKIARLIYYPILMACSYVKKYKNASFNEEYIIPNMLLLWVKEKSDPIDGVAYYSNKTFQNGQHKLGVNFVFPPRSSQNDGFCLSLVDKFQLSKPISWQLLDTFPIKGGDDSLFYNNDPAINDLEEDFFKHYHFTNFGKQEFKLKGFELYSLLTPPSP